MMENKCNKTPNNKYLDHVYCHSSESKNYIRANNNNNNASSNNAGGNGGGGTVAAGQDMMSLLKENKQLKAMLILHLDLIQEQNDQLMAKDKVLANLRDEADGIKCKNTQLEAQVQELQKQLQRQMKRVVAAGCEVSTLPPPPLAKIQCKQDPEAMSSMTSNITTPQLSSLTRTFGDELKADTQDNTAAVVGITAKQQQQHLQQQELLKSTRKNYKIQETTKQHNKKLVAVKTHNHIIGECNGKLISKIILHRVNISGMRSPLSTASDSASELEDVNKKHCSNSRSSSGSTKQQHDDDRVVEEDDEEEGDDDEVGEEEDDDECDEEGHEEQETEDSNDVVSMAAKRKKRSQKSLSLTLPRGAKPRKPLATSERRPALKMCITPPTPSRGGKQMPLMLSHAPEIHSDESASCDSIVESEQRTGSVTSPALTMSPKDLKQSPHLLAPPAQTHSSHHQQQQQQQHNQHHQQQHQHHTQSHQHPQQHHHHHSKLRRCGYLSTPQLYCTRAWEDEQFQCDYEFTKEDVDALQADAPMLEIPKWTEHDIDAAHCSELSEDLADDVFLKRHAKLELDEKRRKKWDVQQIREQRRIEKLKRRHCKDELLNAPEQQQQLHSFYPEPDAIQSICYMHDLPVLAFGEVIPKLSTNANFFLPWREPPTGGGAVTTTATSVAILAATTATTTLQAQQQQQQMLNSSFVFMKKRRRQQSASTSAGVVLVGGAAGGGAITTRLRQQQQQQQAAAAAAATAAVPKVIAAATSTSTTNAPAAPPLCTAAPLNVTTDA